MLALSTAMLLQEESPAALHTIGPHQLPSKLRGKPWKIAVYPLVNPDFRPWSLGESWSAPFLQHFGDPLDHGLFQCPKKNGAKSPLPRSNCPPGWSTAWTWHALHIDHAIRQHLGIRCIDLNQGCDFLGGNGEILQKPWISPPDKWGFHAIRFPGILWKEWPNYAPNLDGVFIAQLVQVAAVNPWNSQKNMEKSVELLHETWIRS